MAVQWHPVLDQALAETAVVGLAEAVSHHLGRRPTKSEITAARRDAATGQAQLTLLPSATAGRKYRILVLARPDVDLKDVQELRQAVAVPARRAAKPQGAGTKDTARRAESLLTQVSHATRAARLLPVSQIEPAHASCSQKTSPRWLPASPPWPPTSPAVHASTPPRPAPTREPTVDSTQPRTT